MSYERIVQQTLSKSIKSLLDNKDLITFSVTRINPDFEDPLFSQYIRALSRLLGQEKIENRIVKYLHCNVSGAVREWEQPRIVILGSQDNAITETKYLVNLLQQCPEGPILKNIRETDRSFYLHRSREITIEDLLAKIKQERKRIIDLPFKPVYYTCDELEAIENLFIPPVYESPRPSDD